MAYKHSTQTTVLAEAAESRTVNCSAPRYQPVAFRGITDARAGSHDPGVNLFLIWMRCGIVAKAGFRGKTLDRMDSQSAQSARGNSVSP